MKCIKADLPRTLDFAEVHIIADLHIGDVHSDRNVWQKRIDHVRDTENAYCILNGDICNWATRNHVSDPYAETIPPMEQIQAFVELFQPVKDKILAVVPGNHEMRAYKTEGVDITKLACIQLGIEDRYSDTAALLFVRLGEQTRGTKETSGSGEVRKVCYVIYTVHGTGGGRKEGAKAIRLADMASIVDADIYIHSHTHLPMVMKQSFYRTDVRNSTAQEVDKLFVNTGATLAYGGYAQANEFKPATMQTPVIYLSGKRKESTAKL